VLVWNVGVGVSCQSAAASHSYFDGRKELVVAFEDGAGRSGRGWIGRVEDGGKLVDAEDVSREIGEMEAVVGAGG